MAMGLIDNLFGSEDDEELDDEAKRERAEHAGFLPQGWLVENKNPRRLIDWDAEVVIYQFYTGQTEAKFDGGAGFGGGGLAAIPLDQTNIDPNDYADPRGMTWEEIENSPRHT